MSPRSIRHILVGAAVALPMALCAVMHMPQAAAAVEPESTTARFYVTLYGFVDNSPPSADISNPVIHSKAGGTGTFDDPVTFATDVREEKPGTIVYYPFLKKYFIMEDTCDECTKDWATSAGNGDNPVPPRNGHRWRIDLWAGGDSRSLKQPDKDDLLNCEDSLTQDNGGDVILNPASNLPVDTTPIYNASTRKCFTP